MQPCTAPAAGPASLLRAQNRQRGCLGNPHLGTLLLPGAVSPFPGTKFPLLNLVPAGAISPFILPPVPAHKGPQTDLSLPGVLITTVPKPPTPPGPKPQLPAPLWRAATLCAAAPLHPAAPSTCKHRCPALFAQLGPASMRQARGHGGASGRTDLLLHSTRHHRPPRGASASLLPPLQVPRELAVCAEVWTCLQGVPNAATPSHEERNFFPDRLITSGTSASQQSLRSGGQRGNRALPPQGKPRWETSAGEATTSGLCPSPRVSTPCRATTGPSRLSPVPCSGVVSLRLGTSRPRCPGTGSAARGAAWELAAFRTNCECRHTG